MRKSSPLPWVKAHTRVLTNPRWLALPMEERGVFDHLCRLAGVSSKRGLVGGTDEEIAALIRCVPELVTRTVEKLSKKPYDSLRRRKDGLMIVNWQEYQTPRNYDPDRYSASDATATQLRSLEGEREGEESRGRVGALVGVLREVRGWPADDDLDGELASKLVRDFPTLDLGEEARRYAVWIMDHPYKANASPRGQFRNWCKNAVVFAARDAAKRPVIAGAARSVEDQERDLRERMRVS